MTQPLPDASPQIRFGNRQPVVASALVIAAVFAVFGIHGPYFPLWLGARGLNSTEIAVVMGAPLILRLAVAPLIGAAADRRPDRRWLIAGLILTSLACAMLLLFARGFWLILPLAALMILAYQPVQSVVDATVGLLVRNGIARDYGRLRLCGSVSFAVVAILAGWLLETAGIDAVFVGCIGLLALAVLASTLLPSTGQRDVPATLGRFRPWERPALMVVLVAVALINASQAMYFSFGSSHLLVIGHPSWSIGVFWTAAVVAEIVVLWYAPSALLHLGPHRLLLVAAIGTGLRWIGMAFDPPFIGLLALQSLHACTLSCTYLGLMGYIQQSVEPEAVARAQSSALTMTGVCTALMTLAVGPIYGALGGHTYLVVAILPALAVLLLVFRRRLPG